MARLVLFGPGYAGRAIVAAARARGWAVAAFGRGAERDEVRAALAGATHVVSTVAPEAGADAVLARHGEALGPRGGGAWLGYLSSTGVYGDVAGAWVDETAPLAGRRSDRIAADRDWAARGAAVLRLPGIYGPGRSVLDRLRSGEAHRVDVPGQVFSRIHLDDIVAGVLAAAERRVAGPFNLADDLPAPQQEVVAHGAALLGIAPPPLVPLADARLSPMARAFYAENRRVASGRARRLLGWRPLHPDYRAGLRALIATTSPATTSPAPATASGDQR